MNHIDNKLLRLGAENNYKVYSSIFRVFTCILLMKEIVNIWLYVPVLYSPNSFIVPPESTSSGLLAPVLMFIKGNVYFFLGLYVGLLCLYCFGIGKKIIAALVFIFFDLFQRICPEILSGGDNLLKFLLLYLIFIDSYSYLSLTPLKQNNKNNIYINNFLSNVFGFCICLHLVMVYFISAVEKIHSDVWFHGIATYYTLQLERFSGTHFNKKLVLNPIFVTLSTYSTLFIEMFYPILVWFNKTKKIIIICMISLHIMIYIFMMIYDFQIIFIMTQGFFFSNKQWLKLIHKYKPKFIFNKIYSYEN